MTSARYPELRGRVALVTGAAKGIGEGVAMRLASEGMSVVAADLDADALASTVETLRALGVEALAHRGDVSAREDIEQLFDAATEAFGTVDVLVNNAAHLGRKRTLDEHDELLDHQLSTNIRGPY
ncbi:MAG: SDR family NAD(P)-dependent oxidoreductase, partial [Acidimicrobiia bacterium]|nr:SDR family NAD(P)-dependent oxidoreductase [Acidimicrobiia bacterium]